MKIALKQRSMGILFFTAQPIISSHLEAISNLCVIFYFPNMWDSNKLSIRQQICQTNVNIYTVCEVVPTPQLFRAWSVNFVNVKYVIMPIRAIPRLISFSNQSQSVQCTGEIEYGISSVLQNHRTLGMKADKRSQLKADTWLDFVSVSMSHSDSIPWTWRFSLKPSELSKLHWFQRSLCWDPEQMWTV